MSSAGNEKTLKAGLVGFGMIVDETYRPFFETVHETALYQRSTGPVEVSLDAVATRTGSRAEKYLAERGDKVGGFQSFAGENAIEEMTSTGLNFACVASPDDRHFDSCKRLLEAGTHLIVEKPSASSCRNWTSWSRWLKKIMSLPRWCTTNCSIPITKRCGPWSMTIS